MGSRRQKFISEGVRVSGFTGLLVLGFCGSWSVGLVRYRRGICGFGFRVKG